MSKIKEFDLFMRNMFTNEEKDQQNKIWQWIERQIKDARVDELENFVTSIIGESEYRDRKERLIMRIKELTGELK